MRNTRAFRVGKTGRARSRLAWPTLLCAALVAACTATPEPTPAADTAPRLTDWRPCPPEVAEKPEAPTPSFECAFLTVPFDYTEPMGPRFTIPMVRLPSTAANPRLLITNPGGPGISGVADLRSGHEYFAGLTDVFTVVSFDPRGIAGSDPAIKCLDESQRLAIFDQSSVPTGPAAEHARKLARDIGSSCHDAFGNALGHVGTADVARDIDTIRAAMGFDTITYLGFSYGTFVGALYADMFPQRTERMVLDSVMDPALTYEEVRHGQAKSMQNSITAFIADCQTRTDCPLEGTPEQALRTVIDIVGTLDSMPFVASDGRTLSGARMLALIESSLYFPDSGWPTLRRTLQQSATGDLEAVTDAAYSSDMMVNPADSEYLSVVCIDFANRRDPATPARLAASWTRESPLSGGNRAWSLQPCESWPVAPVREPAAVRAVGAGPTLILNTTDDPATPLDWARSLHHQLERSSLVIAPAQGHIAISQNSCADTWATRFLRDGTIPETSVYMCPADG